ncbi:MAG: substrate-binding domain-containing protein, partial [Verrucomicrobiota bacterium]
MTGIFRFSHTRRDWVVCRQGNSTMLSWREALETKPDGILGIRLEETGIGPADTGPTPVVILNQAVDDDGFVQVSSDHEECGRRAARHLLERYLRNFAFIGSPSLHFSFLQRRGFEDVLREAGISSPVAYAPTHLSRQPRRFRRWLLSLPRPCGLLSTHSVIGLHVSRVCHEIDLRVPDDVALITITNDDLSCLEAPVTQTSVKPNLENIGYCAAEYLDRWLRRGQASDRLVFIPPSEVTPRESTRVFALEDPLVRRALEVIHDYADPPRTVDDLIARCGKPSRRHLERAFHQSVRASPYQFMLKQRVT